MVALLCTFFECKNSHPFSVKDGLITKWTLIMESTLIMGSRGVAEVACIFVRV